MVAQVNQGTLNRLRVSISFRDHPELNITPPFLGKEMITWSPQGELTKAIPAATGVVTSPEPYQIVEFSAEILKTNGLGDRFKSQWELLSTLGDAVIRGDASTFGDVQVYNTSIKSVDPVKSNGDQAVIVVHMQGAYPINSSLFNAV